MNLSRPAPVRLFVKTGFEWLCIAGLIAFATRFSHQAISAACMLLIATRQHALLALMHEYSHHQLSRKHALLNDLVGDIFTAFPFFITVHGFRRNHFPHHRHVWTAQDPNWVASTKQERFAFPKTRKQFLIELLKHCLGWYTFSDLKRYTVDAGMAVNLPRATRISRAVFAVFVIAAATWLDLWWTVLLYWIVPLSTFLMAILYVRDVGEHFGMASPGYGNSRTVVAGLFERVLIAQNGVNFHAEHHLFPSVPFFRLSRLHQALMNSPEYREHAVITQGYFSGLIDEVTVDGNELPARTKAGLTFN